MNERDHETIVTVAYLAALADGRTAPAEDDELRAALGRLGVADVDAVAQRGSAVRAPLADLARQLSGDDARRLAFETALVVCHADGPLNRQEADFLGALRSAMGLAPATIAELEQSAAGLAAARTAGPVEVRSGKPPSDDALDQMILRQAMIASAVELLPDKLANVVILPLQLRLVYQIGQQYGQKLDANQIKDLAGTLGLGAAAQVMEGVVRKLVGGVTGGLFGGLVGGAGGMAAGVAVTFAATYALGHVAKQYYAQGRRLSTQDLRELFQRFQGDAKEIFPKVQDEIKAQAKSLNLKSLLEGT
ncbi:MAG TPA: TerB family tellurite resistance protein [Gemmatimonadales bacterium]